LYQPSTRLDRTALKTQVTQRKRRKGGEKKKVARVGKRGHYEKTPRPLKIWEDCNAGRAEITGDLTKEGPGGSLYNKAQQNRALSHKEGIKKRPENATKGDQKGPEGKKFWTTLFVRGRGTVGA